MSPKDPFERLKREYASQPDGIASLKSLLDGLEFPITPKQLLEHAGTHVVELREGVMVLFEEAVKGSGKVVFNSPDEVVESIRAELVLKRGFLEEAG